MLPLIISGARRAKKILIPQIKFSVFYPTSPSVFCMNYLSSEIIWCFTLWWNSYYLTGECSPNFFDLIGKDPDAGKDWGQEEKWATEDEMVGWHHWLSGHEFDQTQGDSEGQGSLACCSSWSCKELDMSEQLNSNNNQQNHLLKIQIPTLRHLKLLCQWAVQDLTFLGLMYSVLDLITSFLCNTRQIPLRIWIQFRIPRI